MKEVEYLIELTEASIQRRKRELKGKILQLKETLESALYDLNQENWEPNLFGVVQQSGTTIDRYYAEIREASVNLKDLKNLNRNLDSETTKQQFKEYAFTPRSLVSFNVGDIEYDVHGFFMMSVTDGIIVKRVGGMLAHVLYSDITNVTERKAE